MLKEEVGWLAGLNFIESDDLAIIGVDDGQNVLRDGDFLFVQEIIY